MSSRYSLQALILARMRLSDSGMQLITQKYSRDLDSKSSSCISLSYSLGRIWRRNCPEAYQFLLDSDFQPSTGSIIGL